VSEFHKFSPLNMSPEEITEYTPEWVGERSADGRPRVPDDILKRMGNVSITQAWTVLRSQEYHCQFEGDWFCTQPEGTLVGRALTAMYMPRRPVCRTIMEAKGAEAGCIGDQISWPIDMLAPGDVYVADVYGKVEQGPIIGDNLATAIKANSGNGVVHNAAVRDIDGIQEIEDFVCYTRGISPTYAAPTIMLMGVNCPIRMGQATVMPGDVVLGKNGGVIFVPAHLAEKVVTTSEIVSLRDQFGKQRLSEGVYTPGEIDRRWEEHIEEDFSRWLNDHMDELTVPKETIQDYLQGRTW
jgi:regulator of RNase E activity RraA